MSDLKVSGISGEDMKKAEEWRGEDFGGWTRPPSGESSNDNPCFEYSPRVALSEWRALQEIAAAARDCVCSPSWQGMSDEDVRLEEALIRHGWVIETKGGAE